MKDAELRDLFGRAHAAGYAAGVGHKPDPMVVHYGSGPGAVVFRVGFEPFPGSKVDVVPDGPCGFAWIVLRPGTSRAARWAVNHAGFKKHWAGGVSRWVSDFNQSYEKKLAYAEAYAAVLREAGLNAHADGRLD